MKYKIRKKYQRFLNKIVRELNKSIEKDKLWNGRFFIHQLKSNWIEYKDHSGGVLEVYLEFKDKKTKLTWRGYFNIFDIYCHYHYFYEIFKKFNDFVNYVTQDEKPYDEKQDWRNILYEKDGEVIYPWRA